jgi:SAM-dependent methyltransferase
MGQLLVNLGCGSIFHEAWRNFDVAPSSPEVEYLDVRRGVPIGAGTCDAVYHSHVMEHLVPADGQGLLESCYALLRPGGIVRVVVPDLEGIAREYVQVLDKLAGGGSDALAQSDHEWITLELLDQLVRVRSGGLMADYWKRETIPNEDFLRRRMGWQFTAFRERITKPGEPGTRNPPGFGKIVQKLRQKAASLIVGATCGKAAAAALRESMFRAEGEVHRWMYDRFSLSRLLVESGFEAPRAVGFDESAIGGFAGFGLDSWDGGPRKPDSLFMEARKPS